MRPHLESLKAHIKVLRGEAAANKFLEEDLQLLWDKRCRDQEDLKVVSRDGLRHMGLEEILIAHLKPETEGTMALMSTRQWLQQELGGLKLASSMDSKNEGDKYSQGPKTVATWNVTGSIQAHVQDADDVRLLHPPLSQDWKLDAGTNEGTVTSFVQTITRCVSLCRGVMNTLHRAAGVGDEGRYLWSWLEATSSISQPATGPTVSVSEGQAAAAEAQPDSPLMQAAASRPTAISDAAKRLAAAATPSGGKKQRRGFADAVLQDAVSQCKLMAWELKRPSVIPVAQQRAPDAVACWDVRSGKGREIDLGGIASGVVDNIVEVICQLWLYLTRFTARYGVITTGRTWYFCKVDNGALHISLPIAWDSTNPPLLAAVSYIMTKAWEDKDNTISDSPTGDKPQDGYSSSDHRAETSSEDEMDSDYQGGQRTDTPSEARPSTRHGSSSHREGGARSTRPRKQQSDHRAHSQAGLLPRLQDCPAEVLEMQAQPFAHGWSGRLWRGHIGSAEVVYKLALINSAKGKVLLNEIRAYIRLVHLWSQHVPRLRYWGTTCNGSVLVLATELLPGASLAQHGLISQEAAQDALAALSAVHAAGVLHGDIRPENVMLLSDDARPCVRLIDFGFAQDAQADRMSRESKQFKQLLDKHTKPASLQ